MIICIALQFSWFVFCRIFEDYLAYWWKFFAKFEVIIFPLDQTYSSWVFARFLVNAFCQIHGPWFLPDSW